MVAVLVRVVAILVRNRVFHPNAATNGLGSPWQCTAPRNLLLKMATVAIVVMHQIYEM